MVYISRSTYLLPTIQDLLVTHESLPCQSFHLCRNSRLVVLWEKLLATGCQSLALCSKVISDQAEGTVGDDTGTDVEITRVSSAESKGLLGEAMLRNVFVRSRENCLLSIAKSTGRRRVVV
jgi:hypothetical protein